MRTAARVGRLPQQRDSAREAYDSAALRFNCPSTICAYPRVRLVTSHWRRQQQGGPPVRVATSRMFEQLTYAQIGERLNISSEGARAIVKRNGLPRSHGNDGRTLVAIDLDELRHKPLPARSSRGQPVTEVLATLKARIEQLEAELAVEQQRSAGHRADYEREWERAERADQLVATQDRIIGELKNLRSLLQLAQQAARPVTTRTWRDVAWGWLRTAG